jgi:hypothetical protein
VLNEEEQKVKERMRGSCPNKLSKLIVQITLLFLKLGISGVSDF